MAKLSSPLVATKDTLDTLNVFIMDNQVNMRELADIIDDIKIQQVNMLIHRNQPYTKHLQVKKV